MTVGSAEINDTEQTPVGEKSYRYAMGNLSIVYVTFKNKSLHGSCNILIAITSLADILHVSTSYILGYFLFTGQNFISIYTCLKVQTVSWIGILFSIQLITILAIDRFFCVLMPMWYLRISKKVYVTSYLVLCLPLIGYILFDAYKMAWEHRQLQVICVVVEGIFPTTLGLYFQCQLIMNAITIGCYVGVWFCQKYRTTIRQETSNRILKSVCAITFVLVIGWTVNAIVQMTIGLLLELPQETLFFIELYGGIGPTLACSINYVVLFAFSNDYRTAFKNQFCFNRKTRVTAFVTDTAVQRPTITSSRAPSNT
ncbi:serpentine type 7TM GPCR chemoreceptor srsx domain-containing protein [Ditylenchus destructor]|nr:serpentine type 7TM GPCR chemoreceptor srsx domain-containing protein [Ditylenchus destructor]